MLNVGTVEVRKNPILLYQIYKLAKQRNIELPPLYIVGRKGWLTDEAVYQITYDQDVCNKIFLKHDINDAEMSWLYQNCEFFLFPSYYEGWGLPVAEAAHFGKMSIASNTSSIPEVVGEAAVYASPYDAALWLKLITSMLSIDNRQPYERALRKRKRHSWDETYAQTRQI